MRGACQKLTAPERCTSLDAYLQVLLDDATGFISLRPKDPHFDAVHAFGRSGQRERKQVRRSRFGRTNARALEQATDYHRFGSSAGSMGNNNAFLWMRVTHLALERRTGHEYYCVVFALSPYL